MAWYDTTYFDSEDDYRTGCRNVSHCQQQLSYRTQPAFGVVVVVVAMKFLADFCRFLQAVSMKHVFAKIAIKIC